MQGHERPFTPHQRCCLCALRHWSLLTVVRRLKDSTRSELIKALSGTSCTLHPNLYTLAVRFDEA